MRAQGAASDRSTDWGQHRLLCPLCSRGGNLASGLAADDVTLQWTMARAPPWGHHASAWPGCRPRAATVEQNAAACMGPQGPVPAPAGVRRQHAAWLLAGRPCGRARSA